MKQIHFSHRRSQVVIRILAVFLLTVGMLTAPSLPVLAHEINASRSDLPTPTEEELGRQAFLDFFGPDGVNECLESENNSIHTAPTDDPLLTSHSPMAASNQQAVLTTVWESVGGGRINRKYLNGLVAFCYDEEMAFPNGAIYPYTPASDASVSGQAAAIAQRFGRSGVDNAQWWSECQVAIWAVRAGCGSFDSAAAFARSYCADRKITDPATVEDYAYIVGTLVTETANTNDIAYLYQASDPANQRILTYLYVWPDPAPTYPSPQYDTVSAMETYDACRQHSISIDRKTAAITKEFLAGAIFTVFEDGKAVGTITTDSQGQGSCQWQLTESVSVTITKEYCSNYDKLDPETRKTISGYINREDAYAAAQLEAQAEAQRQAETLANQSRTITIEETTVPNGFSVTTDSFQTVTLTDTDSGKDSGADSDNDSGNGSVNGLHTASANISAVNTPWAATLLIYKADDTTGEMIPDDTIFTLYEWNGSDYEISPHYEIIRREDGIYTVDPVYEDGDPGRLYYTQKNQGNFALAETQAPHGYVPDEEWFYFTITEDGQTIWAHNAMPDHFTLSDEKKFFNQPATGAIQITKTGDYLTGVDPSLMPLQFQYTALPVEGSVFAIYAAEDILLPVGSDQIATYLGNPLYKDTLVTTITTNTRGIALLEGLPLGTYEIREIGAGNGDFLLDPMVATVTLSYQDQHSPVVMHDSTQYHNQRQKIRVSVTKKSLSLENAFTEMLSNPLLENASDLLAQISSLQAVLPAETLSSQLPLSGAVFGLYAASDIYGYIWNDTTASLILSSEPLIFADTLLETVVTDETGQAAFQADLPCSMYYVRELTPPDGYLPGDEVYTADARYAGPDSECVLSFSHTFYNTPTCLLITKTHSQLQTPLAGARLALYRAQETNDPNQEEWISVANWTSEETSQFLWALLPGQYRLVEEQAPHGYYLAEPIEFTISKATPLTIITMENTPIPPRNPLPPSSPGAPTGDSSPLLPTCGGLLGSLIVVTLLVERHLHNKRSRISYCRP